MNRFEIVLWISDMVQQGPHPVQSIESHRVPTVLLLEVYERFEVGAKLVKIAEFHGVNSTAGFCFGQ
jgi:hypothetical protein